MPSRAEFFRDYPFTFVLMYKDATPDVLQQERKRLDAVAEKIGCKILVCPLPNGFQIGLPTQDECLAFARALNPALETTNELVHVEKFENLGPDYARTWADVVKKTAANINIPCEVEVKGTSVIVTLSAIEDYQEFVAANEEGLFDQLVAAERLAKNMLRHLDN